MSFADLNPPPANAVTPDADESYNHKSETDYDPSNGSYTGPQHNTVRTSRSLNLHDARPSHGDQIPELCCTGGMDTAVTRLLDQLSHGIDGAESCIEALPIVLQHELNSDTCDRVQQMARLIVLSGLSKTLLDAGFSIDDVSRQLLCQCNDKIAAFVQQREVPGTSSESVTKQEDCVSS